MSTLLKMQDVRLVYGRRRPTLAIDGLNLAIEQGEFVAVVGPSRLRQIIADEARDRAAAADHRRHRRSPAAR